MNTTVISFFLLSISWVSYATNNSCASKKGKSKNIAGEELVELKRPLKSMFQFAKNKRKLVWVRVNPKEKGLKLSENATLAERSSVGTLCPALFSTYELSKEGDGFAVILTKITPAFYMSVGVIAANGDLSFGNPRTCIGKDPNTMGLILGFFDVKKERTQPTKCLHISRHGRPVRCATERYSSEKFSIEEHSFKVGDKIQFRLQSPSNHEDHDQFLLEVSHNNKVLGSAPIPERFMYPLLPCCILSRGSGFQLIKTSGEN